jgi:hypothetical protein
MWIEILCVVSIILKKIVIWSNILILRAKRVVLEQSYIYKMIYCNLQDRKYQQNILENLFKLTNRLILEGFRSSLLWLLIPTNQEYLNLMKVVHLHILSELFKLKVRVDVKAFFSSIIIDILFLHHIFRF